jgi:hypothetical protein
MPRNKTFRKRRQKRVQKGGAPRTIDRITASLPEFKNDEETKYYGMVRKTRKNLSSVALSGGGGGNSTGGGDDDANYESFIVNQAQKNAICADSTDSAKIMVEDSSKGDSFKQFYDDSMENKQELITFFEFANGAGDSKTLDELKIDKIDDINWTKFVGCP